MARLTTHLLDTARGRPAAGVVVELFFLDEDRKLVARALTNTDGRTDAPLLFGQRIPPGRYELVFRLGPYLRQADFLDYVPVVFRITDPTGDYHVPLLFSPWSYTTYRGS